MDIFAKSSSEKISTRKVMIVADVIRKKPVNEALNLLMLIRKRGSKPLIKALKSAVANAVNNAKKNKDSLFVKRVEVTPGPFLKRYRASTRGRTHPYKKRTSHIKIILEERKKEN